MSIHNLQLPRIFPWHADALCLSLSPEASDQVFFPKMETSEAALDAYQNWCRECPVQQECLTSALVRRDIGIRAGTTTKTRAALLRRRSRARCPQCQAATEVTVRSSVADGATLLFEVCRFCGTSWPADRDPETITHAGRTRLVVDAPIPPMAV